MIEETVCYIFVFLSEALTAWLYLGYVFDKKKSVLAVESFFAIGYVFLFFVSGIKNTNLNALAFCLINYILIKQNFQCAKKSAILHTALLCFLMAGSEVLTALLFNVFGVGFSAHKNNVVILFAQILLSKLMYLIFAILGARIFLPHKERCSEPKFMILFCSLPLLSAVIAILSVYLGMTNGVTRESSIMMLVTTVALLSVNLIFLVLYNYIEKSNDEYLTLQLSLQKEAADIAYYKAIQEQFENQKILVHDIKKHLGIIDALAKQGESSEIEKYVAELNASLSPSRQAKLCTDSILNLLLIHFRDECKDAEVDFQCDVRENISVFMDAASITTLYGNLLSNALESAVQSSEKQIDLSVTWNSSQSVIVISVVNTCDVAPVPNGHGGFYTRKRDKNLHGVGLHSIDRIVKKYNGIATMYYDASTYHFHHVIQFPTAKKMT